MMMDGVTAVMPEQGRGRPGSLELVTPAVLALGGDR